MRYLCIVELRVTVSNVMKVERIAMEAQPGLLSIVALHISLPKI
jgi:hypothetical protein